MEKEGNNFLIHLVHHILEEVVSLELIDKKWIFLLMSGQLYRLFEFVHLSEVGFPSIINDGQGNIFFKIHNDLLTFALVCLLQVSGDIDTLLSVSERNDNTFELIALILIYIFDHRISNSSIAITSLFVKSKELWIEDFDKLFLRFFVKILFRYFRFYTKIFEVFILKILIVISRLVAL